MCRTRLVRDSHQERSRTWYHASERTGVHAAAGAGVCEQGHVSARAEIRGHSGAGGERKGGVECVWCSGCGVHGWGREEEVWEGGSNGGGGGGKERGDRLRRLDFGRCGGVAEGEEPDHGCLLPVDAVAPNGVNSAEKVLT
jgi:hypothetical protein